jgi:uncharacterized membrane-anchored protein YhcB (DUF1043 family)
MILLRKFRRHFGISARRVAVQTHLAWYWRWAIIGLTVGILVGSVWFAYRFSQGFTAVGRDDLVQRVDELKGRLDEVEQEALRLRTELASSERQLQIEKAMRADMTKQLKSLADEASTAKDEAAVLQALLAQSGKAPGVSISRFRVQRDGDKGSFRYRFTLVHAAQGEREFRGQLRLVANVIQDGKTVALALPQAGGEPAPPTALSFKLFQPVEGTFTLPGNLTLRSLEVRVFENGVAQPRLTQTAVLSS